MRPLSFERPNNLGLWGDQSLYFSWICEKGEFLLLALGLPPFGRRFLELFRTRKEVFFFLSVQKRGVCWGKFMEQNPEYKRYIVFAIRKDGLQPMIQTLFAKLK